MPGFALGENGSTQTTVPPDAALAWRHTRLRSYVAMARHVYVIELDAAAGKRRDARIPWVYVGSSAKSPERRFKQHMAGEKSSGIVRRHGVRLRPDLYEDLGAFRGSKEVLVAERARAMQLAKAGFVAHMDGTSYGARAGDWAEWSYRRLLRVADRVDEAIIDLVECAFKPLSTDACVDLLWGVRGFWVTDFIDQDDPPPSYSMFSHVRREALERRTGALVSAGRLGLDGGLLVVG